MGLFKPKAPKAPEGVAYQFHFAGDNRNPDGSYRQGPAELPINAAVERVAMEIVRLRGVISEGVGLPSSEALQRDIDRAYAANAAAGKDLELKRRQFVGGVVTQADVTAAAQDCSRKVVLLRTFQADQQKRKLADAAQTELSRVLAALR